MKVVTTDYILLELICGIHPFIAQCITLYISLCDYFYNNQTFRLAICFMNTYFPVIFYTDFFLKNDVSD